MLNLIFVVVHIAYDTHFRWYSHANQNKLYYKLDKILSVSSILATFVLYVITRAIHLNTKYIFPLFLSILHISGGIPNYIFPLFLSILH